MQFRRAVVLSLFLGSSLQASLLSSVQASGHYFDGFAPPYACSDSDSVAPVAASACSVSPPGNGFHYASGTYSATARYGQLDVDSFSETFNGADLSGHADASFNDTITITGGSGAATLVFTIDAWVFGKGDACFPITSCLPIVTFNMGSLNLFPRQVTQQVTHTFTFGTPFALTAYAGGYSSALGYEGWDATAHFQIDSIIVRGADGNAMSGYSASAASGAIYPFIGDPPAAPVSNPEPATGGVILAALAWLRLRRMGS